MKRISRCLAMVLAVVMLLGTSAFAAPTFTDVQPGDWFYEAVNYCVEQGMVNGMSPTTFAPQGTMTRAQFVTILGRMDGFDTKPYSGYAAFSDEGADTWYTPYINWAAKIGVTDGVTPTTFAPDANVTREQVATFVARYLKLKCLRLQDDAAPAAAFPDSGSLSAWAADAVEAMRIAGLLRGNDKGLVQPGKNMTRAEGATFLMRLHLAIGKAEPNHAWGETVTAQHPTCTEAGVGTRTCTRCGATETQTLPALGHDWQPTGETRTLPVYDLQAHELCDVCRADLTALDYADVRAHLQSHDAEAVGYMKLHVEYVPVETGSVVCGDSGEQHCTRCGASQGGGVHAHDYAPVYDEVELPTYEMKKVLRCSLCDADCTGMTDEEWLEHFDSHGMVPNGKFSIRYDSWEYVQTGTIKQKANIGYACNGCEESISFKVLKPEYTVEKIAGETWTIYYNRCNACNAILSCGAEIDGEIVKFRNLDKTALEHRGAHMDAGESSGYHSDQSREVVSWITTRTLTQFK